MASRAGVVHPGPFSHPAGANQHRRIDMDVPNSKEAVALTLWRVLREKSISKGAEKSVQAELDLYRQCLETVENKKPMRVEKDHDLAKLASSSMELLCGEEEVARNSK
jgi:hypothetical protein